MSLFKQKMKETPGVDKAQGTKHEGRRLEEDPRTGLVLVNIPDKHRKKFQNLDDGIIHHFEELHKINKNGKAQPRICIITNNVVYVCDPKGPVRRCIAIKDIAETICNKKDNLIGLKVPTEYDCFLKTPNVDEIHNILSKCKEFVTGDEMPQESGDGVLSGKHFKDFLKVNKPAEGYALQYQPVSAVGEIDAWQKQKDLLDEKDEQIGKLQGDLDEATQDLEETKGDRDDLAEKLAATQKELEEVQRQNDELGDKYNDLQAYSDKKIAELTAARDSLSEALQSKERALAEATEELEKLREEAPQLAQAKASLEIENERLSAQLKTSAEEAEEKSDKLLVKEQEYEFLRREHEDLITKGEIIETQRMRDEDHHRQLALELEELKSKNERLEINAAQDANRIGSLSTAVQAFKDDQKGIIVENDDLRKQIEQLLDENEDLKGTMKKNESLMKAYQDQMDKFAETPGGKLVQAYNRIDQLEEQLRRRVGIPADIQTEDAQTHDEETGLPIEVNEYIKGLEKDNYELLDKITGRVCALCLRKLDINSYSDPSVKRLADQTVNENRKRNKRGDDTDSRWGKIDDSALLKHLCKADYQFGTKNICLTRIADQLVVKTGGGYLNYSDFVKRFGREEAEKMKKTVLHETERRMSAEQNRDQRRTSLTTFSENPFMPEDDKHTPLHRTSSIRSASAATPQTKSSVLNVSSPGVSPIKHQHNTNTRHVVPTVVRTGGKADWSMPKGRDPSQF